MSESKIDPADIRAVGWHIVVGNGEAGLMGATYRPLPCGCEVAGNGTLPAPLTVKQCATHGAARASKLAQLGEATLEILENRPRGGWTGHTSKLIHDAARRLGLLGEEARQ